MFRHIVAASLLVLGTAHVGPAFGNDRESCGTACVRKMAVAPAVRETMEASVARIAVRATIPASDAAPVTRQDWLKLYIALSLHAKAGAPDTW